jgi:hypothetical protein
MECAAAAQRPTEVDPRITLCLTTVLSRSPPASSQLVYRVDTASSTSVAAQRVPSRAWDARVRPKSADHVLLRR